MKISIFFITLLIFVSGCSEDERLEKFQIQVAPSDPPIIFVSRKLTSVVGGEVIEVEIKGPWMYAGFDVVNDNDTAITIISAEFKVTGPDGKLRTAVVASDNGSEIELFGVFKAEADINCDGSVTVDDQNALPPEDCPLDIANPSYQGSRFYVYDLLQGVDGDSLDPFRGGSFSFEMRLEGWFGGPNNPKEGFFKSINFTVGSNG